MQTAAELIALMQQHVGYTLAAWQKALMDYESDRMDYIVIRGLAKVLMDDMTLVTPECPVDPIALRAHIFQRGPAFDKPDLFHPDTRSDQLQAAATHFGITPTQVETILYSDRSTEAVLQGEVDWTPEALITRYNLELARAALCWSPGLTVEIFDTFKDFWRYLKLFKLMFEARPHRDGYRVQLDGPISPFVQATTRYGRQLAGFLLALLLCEKWSMRAEVRPPQMGKTLTYRLDHTAALTSHFRRSGEFDSRMEADFAAEFHALLSAKGS